MKVVIAGGGTGGHVFPAIAIAHELVARGVAPHFIGAERGMEARAVPAAGFGLTLLPLEPMKGGGLRRALRGGMIAATGVAAAMRELRRLRPAVVLGVGGYAAGPTCLAARLLGIPMAVLEPNAAAGFTNRVLAPLAKRAYLAWPEVGARFRSVRVCGVPVRSRFVASPYRAGRRIVVLGGSQGAKALNTTLPTVFGALRRRKYEISVLHQTGQSSVEETRARYHAEGLLDATVTPFVDDVPAAFAEASLIVARAGASTVAEILASARPSVLVPFPFAADDHQRANAREVERVGAGVCVEEADLGARLPALLEELLGPNEDARSPRLRAMAEAAAAHARPRAAADIAEDLLKLARV